MYKIVKKQELNKFVTLLEIDAPHVAKKAKAGQFIILRTHKEGERIPLTIADYDVNKGTVTIIFLKVGATTKQLGEKKENEYIEDFVGPLGTPSKTDGLKKVAVIGGGVGCAIAYPIAKQLFLNGAFVQVIAGFKNKDLVILEEEFKKVSDNLKIVTDDGSYGEKGLVTDALKNLIESGEKYDEVIAIGPLPMMKYVSLLTKEYDIKTTVSMNPIMIDGTGMCGGCRLSLIEDGKRTVKFACVDGPDFDGYKIDFDEAMSRASMYKDFERHAYEKACNLFTKEVSDNE